MSRRSSLTVAVGFVALLLAGCGSDGSGAASADATPQEVDLEIELVAPLDWPTSMEQRPGTDLLYVTEQLGQVRVLDRSTGELDPQPALDIADEVGASQVGGEPGLIGIAFDPDEPLVYLSFTSYRGEDAEGEGLGYDRVIAEYRLDEEGTAIDAASRRDVLALDMEAPNHNGGAVTFGPDGYLYAGFGDDSPTADRKQVGQDSADLLATIVRIDPSGSAPGEYVVPDDNPFADGVDGAPEVWLYGVRNPWRFAFDSQTDDLWVADVGDHSVEELNFLPATDGPAGRGANLGWSLFEGDEATERNPEADEPDDYVAPAHTYRADETPGCAIIGGKVYRGGEIDDLSGAYLFGDYCSRDVWLAWATDDGLEVFDTDVELPTNILGFGDDADQELYLLLSEGVYRLVDEGAESSEEGEQHDDGGQR